MSDHSTSTCFTCGLPVGEPMRLNHLPSGQVCPTCNERLLESLPSLLPSRPQPALAEMEMEEEEGEEEGEEGPTSQARFELCEPEPEPEESEPPASA